MTLLDDVALWLRRMFGPGPAAEQFCPVCGYYCLGSGGRECIDKPAMVRAESLPNAAPRPGTHDEI